jgi:hypothetical protein
MSYQQEIANWRQQRRQAEAQNRVNELRQEHTQAIRERDHAIASNDLELAASADDQCQYLEQEYAQLVGPQRPQVDPRMAEFVRRRTPFVERHGQAAYQAMDMAHRYATGPRNPNPTPQAVAAGNHGMGLTPGTQAYFDAMDSLLTMYSKDLGLHYDPEEKLLDANQAAKISGLSPQSYNHAAQQIGAQGRYSWQNKGNR